MQSILKREMANFKPAKIERQNAEPVSDLLAKFVSMNNLSEGLLREAVFAAWDQASGASLHSVSKFLKDDILHVSVSSSVVRSRLFFQLDAILEKMNSCLKEDSTLSMLGIRYEVKAIKLR